MGLCMDEGPDDSKRPPRNGRARSRQLAQEAAAERAPLEAELRESLGRTPNAVDKLAIETIAATAVRARRLRADGRNDAEERRLLTQLLRATGLRPAPAAPPTLQAQLAARPFVPPADDDDETDVVAETGKVETIINETASALSEGSP